MATVNTRFLTNILVMVIDQHMNGAIVTNVGGDADYLGQFVDMDRTGNMGVVSADGVGRAADSIGGTPRSEAEHLDTLNRARAEASGLFPAVVTQCGRAPEQPLFAIMTDVLSQAGYR
jgi:hypothetical protein